MRVVARETIRGKAVHTICPKRFRHETIRPLNHWMDASILRSRSFILNFPSYRSLDIVYYD